MLTEPLSAFVIPVEFTCNIITDSVLVPNIYQFNIGIDPISSDPEITSLGFRKIKMLFNDILPNSILINQNHTAFETVKSLDNNTVALPCEPYDFYVGSILMAKLYAITEKHLDIQYVTVSSMIGDNIQYNIASPYDSDLELDGETWWNTDDMWTGGNLAPSWDDVKLNDTSTFKPIVVKGGLSEN